MQGYKVTEKQKVKILILLEQGVPQKYIAERFDITQTTVSVIKRNNKKGNK